MATFKKSAKKAMTRGRDTASRIGKLAKSVAVVAARAGASAAIAAGTLEAQKSWKESSPEAKRKRTRNKIVAAIAGAAVLGAAGVAIAKSRNKK